MNKFICKETIGIPSIACGWCVDRVMGCELYKKAPSCERSAASKCARTGGECSLPDEWDHKWCAVFIDRKDISWEVADEKQRRNK